MVNVHKNKRLNELGWKLLLQIHDELILEGPQQNAEEALQIVKHCMQNPFNFKLQVNLEVDAKIADNWYDGK